METFDPTKIHIWRYFKLSQVDLKKYKSMGCKDMWIKLNSLNYKNKEVLVDIKIDNWIVRYTDR